MPEEERWRAKPRRRYRPTRRVELIEILKRDAVPALSVRLAVRHVSLLEGRGYHGPSAPRCCGGLPVEAAGTSKLNPSVRGDLASLHRRPGRCIIVAREQKPRWSPATSPSGTDGTSWCTGRTRRGSRRSTASAVGGNSTTANASTATSPRRSGSGAKQPVGSGCAKPVWRERPCRGSQSAASAGEGSRPGTPGAGNGSSVSGGAWTVLDSYPKAGAIGGARTASSTGETAQARCDGAGWRRGCAGRAVRLRGPLCPAGSGRSSVAGAWTERRS